MNGRPLKFKDAEELQRKIDEYFKSCYDYKRDMFGNRLVDDEATKENGGTKVYVMIKFQVYTVSGLAVFLDTTRETLMDYEKGKYDNKGDDGEPIELTREELEYNEQVDKFSDTIKRAKQIIAADTEQQLYSPGKSTGAIFSLKNNYGWRDRTETELTNPDGNLAPVVRIIDERPKTKSPSE